MAAAALHAGLWLAWPSAGLTGGWQVLSPAAVAQPPVGHHLARMVVRADPRTDAREVSAQTPATPGSHDVGMGHEASPRPDSPSGGPAWLANRYLDADQVERSPRPVHGWFLDEEALLGVGRTHVLIKLWVSAAGRIDHAEVLQADPPGDWVGQALRTLPGTPMEPATQGGRPVAAVTVVELQTENEQVH